MALLEDLFKSDPVTGIAIGVGAVLLGPTVVAAVGQVLRPAAKAAIKGGMVLYDQMAEIGEAASDLFAEAQADLGAEPASVSSSSPEQHPPSTPGSSTRGRRKPSPKTAI